MGEGGCSSIYTQFEAVLEIKFSASTGLHHLCMPSCHRQTKGWQRGAGRGSPAPRGRPPPDLAPSPPPLRDGLVLGPGLLLSRYYAQIVVLDGPLYLAFAQIGVGKRLSVYSPMYLCLCSAKQYSPNTCGTRSIIIPITKFGVYMNGFYAGIGG